MHIRARDLNGLFTDAGHALMAIMYRGQARPEQEISIQVSGESPEHLLHGFLSELLFESEVRNLVFSDFVISLEEKRLNAILIGEPFIHAVHGGGAEVKGISWYGLSITREKDEYSCDILFDV